MISIKKISLILLLYIISADFVFASSTNTNDSSTNEQDDTQPFVIYPSSKTQLMDKRDSLITPESNPVTTDKCNDVHEFGTSIFSIENKTNMIEILPKDQQQSLNIPISAMSYSFFFNNKELTMIKNSIKKKNSP